MVRPVDPYPPTTKYSDIASCQYCGRRDVPMFGACMGCGAPLHDGPVSIEITTVRDEFRRMMRGK